MDFSLNDMDPDEVRILLRKEKVRLLKQLIESRAVLRAAVERVEKLEARLKEVEDGEAILDDEDGRRRYRD